jgi:adenosyl cobinamide kinase/adenosyl cobinamide phosphate guanylyltransferase
MALVLLIGGARSGKSALAVTLAARAGDPTTLIATGEPGDDEMAARIARHRAGRPESWQTVEEPLELVAAIERMSCCLIVDCLTLWTSNMLAARGAAATEREAERAAAAAATREPLTIAVTNEVGTGIVPDNELARVFRDLHGRVNLAWADLADRVYLVVAGRALALEEIA